MGSLYKFFYIFLVFIAARCQADPLGCVLNKTLLNVDGLVGNVYYYPFSVLTSNQATVYYLGYDYFSSYASNPNIITAGDGHPDSERATAALGVRMTDFNWFVAYKSIETWDYAPYLTFENGSNPFIPIDNYAMSLNGYLIPNITGVYTFAVHSEDLEIYVTIGNGVAPFGCCEIPDQTLGISTTKSQIHSSDTTFGGYVNIPLVAGFAYPINLFFVVDNIFYNSVNTLSYMDPTGKTSTDLTGLAFSSFDIEKEVICPVEEEQKTVFWTEDTTSTTTLSSSSTFTTTYTTTAGSLVIDCALDISEYVLNYVPYSYETLTSYIPYDGSEVTTTSTETIIDATETKKIFDVNVPYSTSLSVSTSFYNGTVATNASTVLVTVTPASGTPYVSAVVFENIPEGHTSSTMYISGNNTVETTYSTDYLTVNGTDGVPTVETVYYVQTPYSIFSTTTTSFYEGDSELTQTTIVTTVTPVNGSIYINEIVVIDKPEAVEKATVFNTGTYTDSTTVSTGSVTLYGFDGMPTVFKTYYVAVPTSSSTSTSANSTSTSSNSTSTFANSTSTSYSSTATFVNSTTTLSSSTSSFVSSTSTTSSSSLTFANMTSTASSTTSNFNSSNFTTKGPSYSNSTSKTYESSPTYDSISLSSFITPSSYPTFSTSILVESQILTSTLVTCDETDGTSASLSTTDIDESMTAISQSPLTLSDYTTTATTITSCGSETCYPKTLATIAPVSSSTVETSSHASTSSAPLSIVQSVESNAAVFNGNVGFLNKFVCAIAAYIIFI